ncbi:hypothetical protein QQF54_09255 [Lelliottia sp. V106_10]|nr:MULTISPECIES: hypothetical protein [unclassified Lelliottia]MDK9358851.1 hypothetical protein [Lelliottia sp. V106_16]MDK9373538.1 hypothetical protein [Lelliottia sp. V106_10]MDK9600421.1 hypothetical protein [Lelliottia sp. V106_5]
MVGFSSLFNNHWYFGTGAVVFASMAVTTGEPKGSPVVVAGLLTLS